MAGSGLPSAVMKPVAILFGLWFAAGTPAAAETDGTTPVQAYGTVNKECAIWGDGCVTCARGARAAAPSCSTPGIACQPGPVTCHGEAVTPR